MPKNKLDKEELEAGQISGIVKRTDQKLFDEIEREARITGKKKSDIIRDALKRGLGYKRYEDINGETIMLVLDILDRIMGYMSEWKAQSTLKEMLQSLEVANRLVTTYAPQMGYYTDEEVKEIVEKVKANVKAELQKQNMLDQKISQVVDKVVDTFTDALLQRAQEMGILDKMVEAIAGMLGARE